MAQQTMAQQYAFTAGNIRAAIISEAYMAEPGYKSDTMENGIQWTGQLYVDPAANTVWFEILQPGSWHGKAWFSGAKGPDGYLVSLEPEDLAALQQQQQPLRSL